jgi:hypothetical protein
MSERWELPAGARGDSGFVRLHAYWRGKIRDGRLPGRADIHPDELPAELLPYVALIAVEGDGAARRYRIRLQGSALQAVTGRDETGQYYDAVTTPAAYAVIARLLGEAVDECRPVFLAAPSAAAGRDFLSFGRLGLPLAGDGATVDMILALVRPLSAAAPASEPN